jgi:hypothetical protein
MMEYYHARLSANELDLLLGYDPEMLPGENPEKKIAELTRYVNSVQSIIDDSIEEW